MPDVGGPSTAERPTGQRPAADRPTVERLAALAEGMVGRPVIMAVDLVADRYISGSPKRVSREAPIVILRFEREDWVLGGGANAIANVRALGGVPLPLGVLGTDEPGRRIRAELERLGITTEGILDLEDHLTPTKTRIMGGDAHSVRQQVARYDVESVAQIGETERRHFGTCLGRWSGRAAVAVMSDYGYGAVLPEMLEEIRGALSAPRCVLCDSRYRLADFTGMTGATPNQEEVEGLTGGTVADDEGRVASGRELRRRLAAEFLLMTRGSQGMLLFEADRLTRIPVHGTGLVADVTGAGDTVIGTLALARAAGASPVEAALLANYAAGVVVHKPGTATASTDELRRAILSDPVPVEQCRSERL